MSFICSMAGRVAFMSNFYTIHRTHKVKITIIIIIIVIIIKI